MGRGKNKGRSQSAWGSEDETDGWATPQPPRGKAARRRAAQSQRLGAPAANPDGADSSEERPPPASAPPRAAGLRLPLRASNGGAGDDAEDVDVTKVR